MVAKTERGFTTMANSNQNNNSVAAAENLLQEMKQRAAEAHKNNDVFMMSVMAQLLKVVSPIVTKAIARKHREDLARINADHRELREQAKNQKDQSPSQSGPKPTSRLGD
jgi:hypothetical protein